MSGEVVPFGKYKGQPVEILAADTDYCEWLTAQPWFKARYLNVYNTIINYGGEPSETPEHNEMQARFLDDDWCFRLADVLKPGKKGQYGEAAACKLLEADPMYKLFEAVVELEVDPAAIHGRKFEDQGWDVTYGIDSACITANLSSMESMPPCTCKCDHANCRVNAKCKGGESEWSCDHYRCAVPPKLRTISYGDHCTKGCYWREMPDKQRTWLQERSHFFSPPYEGVLRVECKPDLGDDYPAVLRQVLRYPNDGWRDKRCVLVRRHAFEKVTWEQVEQIFKGSQIQLVHEAALRGDQP